MSSDIHLIAARYVSALFALADDKNEHDAVKKDMETLRTMIAQSAELTKLFTSPVITRANAEKAVTALLTAIKAGELTRQFFTLLARARRLAITPAVIDQYLERLAASRGEVTAHVTSATALSAGEIKTLAGALAKATGKKVEIKTRENPGILGGIQVRVGSRMLDHSIAGKLARLKRVLTRAA